MVNAGNRVVFDKDLSGRSLSHIMNKAAGKCTTIHEKNGTFQFNIMVPKGPVEAVNPRSEVNAAEGFPRPGTLEAD
eukprot:3879288-Pyramimonas_sp.AAC.1